MTRRDWGARAAALLAIALGGCSGGEGLQGEFPNGTRFSLADYSGKVLLIEFLSTVCPHCIRSSQLIEPVYRELKSQGFEVVGIALNQNSPATVRAFAQQYEVTFPIAIGDEASAREFLEFPEEEIFYVPRLAFLGRDGVIREKYFGGDAFVTGDEQTNVRQLAARLLAEQE